MHPFVCRSLRRNDNCSYCASSHEQNVHHRDLGFDGLVRYVWRHLFSYPFLKYVHSQASSKFKRLQRAFKRYRLLRSCVMYALSMFILLRGGARKVPTLRWYARGCPIWAACH